MTLLWRNTVGLLCVTSLTSCSNAIDPTPSPVGSYVATTLTLIDGGQSIDLLSQGGSLTLTLESGGNTSGRLFAPAGGDNGQDLDENLAGTWSQTGNTIRFSQSADTFIRDTSWTVEGSTLRTSFTLGSTTVNAVLTKQ
jgi:hypothetical protein